MKTSYHIGEMSEYFGISADTLRMYDKKGILSPRKEANGYRIYGREDMIFLEYVLRLRRLGLSLKDVKKLTEGSSMQDLERVLETQSQRVRLRIQELEMLLSVTSDFSCALRETREKLGDITIVTSPRLILRLIGDSLIDSLSAFKQFGSSVCPWFCTLTEPKDILAEDGVFNIYDYNTRNNALKNAIIVIDRNSSVSIPEKCKHEFIVLEPKKCLYMAAHARSLTDYEAFVRLRQFTLENGYEATGAMISIFIAVRSGIHGEDDFYQVYLPIK